MKLSATVVAALAGSSGSLGPYRGGAATSKLKGLRDSDFVEVNCHA